MKILYLVSGLSSVGGIENFCYSVLEYIDLTKFNIDFLVSDGTIGDKEEYVASKGSKIYHINHNGTTKDRVKKRNEFFKSHRNEYDVVHIHTVSTTAFQSAKIAKKYGAKCVVVHSHTASDYHGLKWKNIICRSLLNHYTDIRAACSKNAGEFLFGKSFAKNGMVINNGIDYAKFYYNENTRAQMRNELGMKEDAFVVGHIGRMAEAKNHSFLLDVFDKMLKNMPNAKLLLVGDGELKNEIVAKVKRLGIDDSVVLTGYRSDTRDLLNAMDIFVFPSLYEGAPISLIEAQVNGLTVLASDKITKEIAISEGIIFLPIDKGTEVWYDNIIKHDNRAANVCDSRYDINKTIEQLAKLYDKIVSR